VDKFTRTYEFAEAAYPIIRKITDLRPRRRLRSGDIDPYWTSLYNLKKFLSNAEDPSEQIKLIIYDLLQYGVRKVLDEIERISDIRREYDRLWYAEKERFAKLGEALTNLIIAPSPDELTEEAELIKTRIHSQYRIIAQKSKDDLGLEDIVALKEALLQQHKSARNIKKAIFLELRDFDKISGDRHRLQVAQRNFRWAVWGLVISSVANVGVVIYQNPEVFFDLLQWIADFFECVSSWSCVRHQLLVC